MSILSQAHFDANGCVIGLESQLKLISKYNTIETALHLQGSDGAAGAVATGTIGDMGLDENDEPVCHVANLEELLVVNNFIDTNVQLVEVFNFFFFIFSSKNRGFSFHA